MGEEKWMRRKPGRVSGTVVPPPVGDDPAALPQRKGVARSRHRAEEFPHGPTGGSPPPVLPDNVRPLFQPVLQSRDSRPPRDREPDARTPGSAQRAEGRTAARDRPPVQADGSGVSGRAGSAVAHDWPASDSWSSDPAAGTSTAVGTMIAEHAPRDALAAGTQRSRADRRRSGGSGRRHVAWLAALTVLLMLTAAGTAVALLGQHSNSGKSSGGPSGTPLAGAAAVRAEAARWVSREVSRSAFVGCDTVMCAQLVKAGVPSSYLVLVRNGTQDPLGADVIVATPILRSQFGPRLSTEYAPAVLASFGAGSTRVDVRVIASYGADAYQLALTRDIAARDLQGTQLVGNSRIALPPSAKTELAAGQVDPRLLLTLPALAQKHPVRVLAFYNRAPGASSGIPFSGVKLAGSDPKAGLPAHAYLRWLVSFLHSQRWVYRAASVTTAWHHGRAIVFVRFALPNPVGLLH